MRGFLRSLATCGLSLLACSGESAEPMSALATDGGTTEAAAAQSCSAVSACPTPSTLFQTLLTAQDVGPDAQFVAVGRQAVLVMRGAGVFQAVRLNDPDTHDAADPSAKFAAWSFPQGAPTARAITEGTLMNGGRITPSVFVLACAEGDRVCSVLRGERGQPQLSSWQTVPADFDARGIILDPVTVQQRQLCVYGAGMLCFDGSAWQPAIDVASELELNAAAIGSTWSIAVGEHGRWWKRTVAAGTWQEQAALNDVSLTQCSVSGEGGVIVGEGRLQLALGTQQGHFACTGDQPLAALLLTDSIDNAAYAVTSDAAILTGVAPNPFCQATVAKDERVLAVTSVPCGASDNLRILTSQTLLGSNVCIQL
jgi:hypothetical protein